MNWRFWCWLLFWGFLAWWVIENPQSAAQLIRGTGHLFSHAARSLAIIIKEI